MSDNTIEGRRSDFIKRLFSVAASVGFATQIGAQEWIRQGQPPSLEQIPALLTLIGSIIVVVRSWEGYFETIARIELKDKSRFYLDIFIVMLYITLLNAVFHQCFWQWTLAAIFLSYFIWDALTWRITRRNTRNSWTQFRPHSAWWLLFLSCVATLVTYGPFHPFRYTIISTFSVLAFRWKFASRNFGIHFCIAMILAAFIVFVRNYYV